MKKIVTLVCILSLMFVANAQDRELQALQDTLRANNASWTAGETSVSRLSAMEQEKVLGLLPGVYDLANFPAETINSTPVERGSYESKHTPIRNQGSCGSCYSFGACATYEAWLIKTQGTTVDLSEQYFMMKAKAIGPYGGCSGWYLDTSMNLLKNYGVAKESDCPYKAAESACPSGIATPYKITSWASTSDKTTIQNAVKAYGLVYVGFAVYNDFMSYTSGYYAYTTGSLRGYHAVAVVGFDDVGFKVKNSWGTGWGESGYFRIKYDQMTNSVQFGTCFGGSFYITK
jgi:C1A family cysteine protease